MKTKHIFMGLCMVAAFTMGLASCESDEMDVFTSTENTMTLKAVIGNNTLTRVMIDLDNEDESAEYVYWNKNDCFWVVNLGAYGHNNAGPSYNFEILDCDEDSHPTEADFYCNYSDTGGLSDGDWIYALYSPGRKGSSGNNICMSLENEYDLGANSDDEIEAHLKYNMFMFAKTQYSENATTTLTFDHLTSMARITYVNGTGEEKNITSVSISSNENYFSTAMDYDVVYQTYEVSGQTNVVSETFDGLTLKTGKAMDFYFLFFPSDTEFSSDGVITITINDELSVEMSAADITTSSIFEPGYRYWFGVAETSDGLFWSKDVDVEIISDDEDEDNEEDDDYAKVEKTDDNESFLNYLVNNYDGVILDADGNAYIPNSVIESTTEMDLGVSNVEGIGVFENLEYLYCIGCGLTELDLTGLINLKELHCWGNSLTTLDLSTNTALEYLGCDENNLTEIVFGENTALTYIDCSSNSLTSLDVSNLALEYLDIDDNPYLTSLDFSGNNLSSVNGLSNITTLTYLDCSDNYFSYLDITGYSSLTEWYCGNQKDGDLSLYLTEDQLTIWESSLSEHEKNANVNIDGTGTGSTGDDSEDSEEGLGSESDTTVGGFSNGGKYY